jgi:hypothetical protein
LHRGSTESKLPLHQWQDDSTYVLGWAQVPAIEHVTVPQAWPIGQDSTAVNLTAR